MRIDVEDKSKAHPNEPYHAEHHIHSILLQYTAAADTHKSGATAPQAIDRARGKSGVSGLKR